MFDIKIIKEQSFHENLCFQQGGQNCGKSEWSKSY